MNHPAEPRGPREPGDEVTALLRTSLARAATQVVVPDLSERVHAQARRVRRRRQAVAGSLATVVVMLGTVGLARQGWPRPDSGTSVATSPAPRPTSQTDRPSPAQTLTATTSATPDKSAGATPSRSVTRSPATASSGPRATGPAATGPAATGSAATGVPGWGAGFRDDFSGPLPESGRWRVYGANGVQPWTTFAAGNVTVHDGLVDLAMTRSGPGQQLISGMGALHSPQRYGRWELRWRITGGSATSGGFIMAGAGPDDFPLEAYLRPDQGVLLLTHQATGEIVRVPTDVTAFHRLALEWTPDRVRWLLDGRQVAGWTDGLPTQPLGMALQTDVMLDCRPTPQPTACTQQDLPQHLLVDWLQYSAYRP